MHIQTVINQMLVLLILLIVGVIARKTRITDEVSNKKLSRLLINVCQSAMILSSVMNTESEITVGAVFKIVGVSVLLYVLLIALAPVIPRLLGVKKDSRGVYMFMTVFGNVGFMGFPVIASVFGDEAVFYASLFNIPFNLLMYTLGIALISGGERAKLSPRLLINAPLVSTLVALAILLLKVPIPSPLAEATGLLGDMVVPAAMLVIGSSLGGAPLRSMLGSWRLYIFAPIKLILLPAAVYYIFRLFVTDSMILGIAVVMAALPVATNCTMLCIEYGGDETLATGGTLITTVLSVVTIPLMVYLLLA